MAEAQVRFFGELNDHLPYPARGRSLSVPLDGPTAARDVIERLGAPHVEVAVITRNGDPIGLDARIEPGDRLGVYPAFRTLDLAATPQAGHPLPEAPTFIVDGHLARLAAYLRLLGCDTLHEVPGDDEQLAQRSAQEGRVLLTRDRGLLKRAIVQQGYWVRAKAPEEQLAEVAHRFRLGRCARPFSRCLRCNGLLEPVEAAALVAQLPPSVVERGLSLTRCRSCGRVYWEGSHQRRLQALVEQALANT